MKKLMLYIMAAGMIISLGSCKKSFLDVNTNPNTPTTTTPELVFTGAVNRYISYQTPHLLGSYFAGQYSQSTSFIGGQPNLTYVITSSDYDFISTYYDILNDFQYVIDNSTGANKHLAGYSRVFKALIFQRLVDTYGDVPYSQALKGTASLQPKYDDQKAIYEDLIKVLDTAITTIKASTATEETADIVFPGKTFSQKKTLWIKFANTLKLQILMRQSFIPGRDSYITTEINRAAAEGTGFLEQGEDVTATPGYQPGSAGKINPFYNTFGYDQNGAQQGNNRLVRISETAINLLKNTNDTFRLKRIAYPKGGEAGAAITANYVGVPYGGTGSAYLETLVSGIGPAQIVKGVQDKPMFIMGAHRSFFLRAEAKQRYAGVNLPLSAQQYYEQGVRESFRMEGATDAQATTLLTSGKPDADWTASTDKLRAIYIQKWIALINFDGLEAWAEQRRTETPAIPLSLQAARPKQPVRLPYPLVEESSNTANVPKNIDIFNTKIFWDVN